jgi:CBS domain containing-hemolysin-like protein
MGISAKIFGGKRNLKISLIFLAICVILTVIALIMGINDNIPGFIVLVLGAFSLALAIVHGWRKSRKFVILTISSFIGLFVFAVLHEVFEELAGKSADMVFVYYIFAAIAVFSFFLALMVCPVGFLTGIFGFAILRIKKYRERKKQTKQDV